MAFEHDDEPRAAVPLEPEGEDEDEQEAAELEELAPGEAETIEELERAEEDALDTAHQEYLTAVFEHFGPEQPAMPCPICQTRGYLLTALQSDPTAVRCDDCAGLGIVATGSLVHGNETRPCTRCHGAGYVPTIAEQPQQAPTAQPPPPAILPPSAFPPAPQPQPVAV